MTNEGGSVSRKGIAKYNKLTKGGVSILGFKSRLTIRRSTFFIAVALMAAAFAGVVFVDFSPLASAEDWTMKNKMGNDLTQEELVLIKDITLTGGSVTLLPGYAYYIELAGARGGTGSALGGNGAIVGAWMNLVWNNKNETFSYTIGGIGSNSTTSTAGGGAGGGGAGGNGATFGGAGGGGASTLSYGDIKLMVAGGGGGGGGPSNNDTAGGTGGSAGYPSGTNPVAGVYNGNAGGRGGGGQAGGGGGAGTGNGGSGGTAGGSGGSIGIAGYPGSGPNAGGNGGAGSGDATGSGGGGGGAGYAGGGGGGSGHTGPASGGGGGGGSSFISNWLTPAKGASWNAGGYITIKQYAIVEPGTIVTDGKTVTYNGSPQTIVEETVAIIGERTGIGPEDPASYLTFSYTGTTADGTTYGPTDVAPTEAGTYNVTISFDNKQKRYTHPSGYEVETTLVILPQSLTIPTAIDNRVPYDGGKPVTLPLNDFIDDAKIMTITGNVETKISEDGTPYIAKIALTDKFNYCWADDTTDDIEIEWYILESRSIEGVVTFHNLYDAKDPRNGTPLEGVYIKYSTKFGSYDEVERISEVPTDSNGRYTILFVSGDVLTLKDGLKEGYKTVPDQLPREFTVSDTAADFEMCYDPLFEFRVWGTVTLGDTAITIPNVLIEYTVTIGNDTVTKYVTTGSDGIYEIKAAAGSILKITHVTMSGYLEDVEGVPWGPTLITTDQNVDFHLYYANEFHKLEGHVYDKNHNPIPGARVEFSVWLDSGGSDDDDFDGIPDSVLRSGYVYTDSYGRYDIIVGADESDIFWMWVEITGVYKFGYRLDPKLPDLPTGSGLVYTDFKEPRIHKMDNPMEAPIQQDFTMRALFIVEFDPDNGQSSWFVEVTNHSNILDEPVKPTRAGFVFKGWFAPGSSSPWVFSVPVSESMKLTAKWERIPGMWIVDVNATHATYEFVEPFEAAVVHNGKLIINFQASLGYVLPSDITVTMNGYPLSELLYAWEAIDLTHAVFTIEQVTGDVVITVEGEESGVIITFGVNGLGGSLTATNDGEVLDSPALVNKGDMVEFKAFPLDETWRVKAWYVNGAAVPDATSSTFIHKVTGSATITLEYERITHTLKFCVVNHPGSLIASVVDGQANIPSPYAVITGYKVLFFAVPTEGYKVKAWYVNGAVVPNMTSTAFTYTVTDDATVKVEFEINPLYNFRVWGTVSLGETGIPIPNVLIEYTLTVGSVTVAYQTMTGSGGSYEIKAPAGSTLKITRIAMSGYSEDVDGVPWGPTFIIAHHNVDFHLGYADDFHKLEGYVYDEKGKPLSGAKVEFNVWLDCGGTTDADDDGIPDSVFRSGYAYTGADGHYEIIVGAHESDIYWMWVEITGVTLFGYLLDPEFLAMPLNGGLVSEDFEAPRFHKMDNPMNKPIRQSFNLRTLFIVKFDPRNGQTPWLVEVKDKNNILEEPPEPIRAGFTFKGWLVDIDSPESKWDFKEPVSKDMTLTAKWERIPGMWIVDVNATHATYEFVKPGEAAVWNNDPLIINFNSSLGFVLPSGIKVTMGGSLLSSTEYTWNIISPTKAVLTIASVTGDVDITVVGEPSGIVVTFGVYGLGGSLTANVGDEYLNSPALVNMGDIVYFVATPQDATWRVKAWYVNGTVVPGAKSTNFKHHMTGSATVMVEFELITHTVQFGVVNPAGGTLAASDINGQADIPSPFTVITGHKVMFFATYSDGYKVKAWYVNGAVVPDAATTTFTYTVTSDVNVMVEFVQYYTVSAYGEKVTGADPNTVQHGTTKFTATVTAAANYHIEDIISVKMGGTSLVKGTGYKVSGAVVTFLVPITGNIEITAAAEPNAYNVSAEGYKVAGADPAKVKHDQTDVVITINAADGYHVTGITSVEMNGITLIKGICYKVSDGVVTIKGPVTGAILITATAEPNIYTVSAEGDKVAGADLAEVKHDQTNIVITVSADDGYHMTGIASVTMAGKDLKKGVDYTVEGSVVTIKGPVTGAILITATTAPDVYEVTATGSKVAGADPATVEHDQTNVVITINANNGYHVTGVTLVEMNGNKLEIGDGYDVSSEGNIVTIAASVTGAILITATTAPDIYDVIATGSKVAGADPAKVEHDQTGVVITINASDGYHVTGVTSVKMNGNVLEIGDGYTVSLEENTVTITASVTGDILITATTAPDIYDVIATGNKVAGADPAKVEHDQTGVVITINASDGYHVTSVTSVKMNGDELEIGDGYTATESTVTIKVPVTGDILITATTAPDVYKVTATGSKVAGADPKSVVHDQTDVVITINASDGYHVAGVTSVTMAGDELVEGIGYTVSLTESTVTINVPITGDILITATTAPDVYEVTATGEHVIGANPATVEHDQTGVVITINPDNDYHLTDVISVTMDGNELVEGLGYTVSLTESTVTIKVPVTGNIEIVAAAVLDIHLVSATGDHVIGANPSTVEHGASNFEATITTDVGYHVEHVESVEMDGNELEEGSDYTVSGAIVTFLVPDTGDIEIVATTVLNMYSVSAIGNHVIGSDITEAEHFQEDVVITIAVAVGYHVIGIISVTMGESTLAAGEYTLSLTESTVTINVPVTGDIEITATTAVNTYGVSVTGSDKATGTDPEEVEHFQEGVVITIATAVGYHVDDVETVKMNGATLVEGTHYTVSEAVVTLLVPVTGDIEVTVATAVNTYGVSVIGSDKATGTDPAEVDHFQEDVVITIATAVGYHVDDVEMVKMNGAALVKGAHYTVSGAVVSLLVPVTGDIEVTVATAVNTYGVSVTGSDKATGTDPEGVEHFQEGVEITIATAVGYHVDDVETVKMNGETLVEGTHYTVSEAVVTLLVPVTGDIEVTVATAVNTYGVSVTGSDKVIGTDTEGVEHFQEGVEITIATATGYHVDDVETVKMNGETLVEGTHYTVSGAVVTLLVPVTGEIEITATTAVNTYGVSVTGSDKATGTDPAEADHFQEGIVITIATEVGYHVDSVETVKMNGETLVKGTHYTVSGAVVSLLVPVTGAIEIHANVGPDAFSVTGIVTNQSNGMPLSGVRIAYVIDSGSNALITDSTITGTDGGYIIPAYTGLVVTIIDVTLKGWTLFDSETVLPAGPFSNNDAQDFEMLINYLVPSSKQYYITATSDGMTAVSPEGTAVVPGGTDQTFYFSAEAGHHVSRVIVDGKGLSQQEIDLGYYTFHKVNSNHTIQVQGGIGLKAMLILFIDIMEGKGSALFSVDGQPFQIYKEPASVLLNSEVTVRAYADDGYGFREWRDGGDVITTSEYTMYGPTGPVKEIQLYFSGSDSGISLLLWFAMTMLLIFGALLIWFIFFYRRYVDVIKVSHTSEIVGRSRVRRKGEYRFSIEGGFSGTVSYHIGEDGEWKSLLPVSEGKYVIPRGEIIDTLTIETR